MIDRRPSTPPHFWLFVPGLGWAIFGLWLPRHPNHK